MEIEVPWGRPSGDSKTGGTAVVQEANEVWPGSQVL